jgi:hypothetical protein
MNRARELEAVMESITAEERAATVGAMPTAERGGALEAMAPELRVATVSAMSKTSAMNRGSIERQHLRAPGSGELPREGTLTRQFRSRSGP